MRTIEKPPTGYIPRREVALEYIDHVREAIRADDLPAARWWMDRLQELQANG